MFVKKIPRWKIKRFIKGVIRSILYFVVISSLCITVHADVVYPSDGYFDSFDQWVGDGSVDYLLRASNSDIIKTGTYYGSDQNLDEMSFANNNGPFDHVRMTVGSDSSFIQRSFKSGDIIVLRQFIAVYMANGVVNDKYADKFTIVVNYETSDFVQHSVEFRGKNCLKDAFYYEYQHGVSVFFDVNLNGVIANVDGEITSISYHFYEIASNNYNFVIYPSYKQDGTSDFAPMTYYIGSQSSAPLYPSVDGSSLTDLEDSESDVLYKYKLIQEDFFNRFDEPGVTDFESWANNFWPVSGASIGNWLAAASSLFSVIWDWLPWHIIAIIKFLLLFGIFGFILNLVSSFWRSKHG